MRILDDVKLDYQDVLFRPKRSTLKSRKDVLLERSFTFYHSPKKWTGLPIMTANMATCGTFEMARILSKYKMVTTFHKYYSIKDYEKFFKTFKNPDYICYTLGIRRSRYKTIKNDEEKGIIRKFFFYLLRRSKRIFTKF